MRGKNLFLVCFFFLLCSPILVKGQSDSIAPSNPKLLLGLDITRIFNRGLKLDVIVPLKPKLHLYMSPEYYAGKLQWAEEGYMKGYGFQGGARYVFWKEAKQKKLSMAFAHVSLAYNHFRIDTEDFIWVEKTVNNQQVLVQEKAPVFKEYNRVSMDYVLGMIWKQKTGLYAEWNFGISVREVKSKFTENYKPSNINDDYAWSYGRAGVLPTMGFRLGFVLD